jgi:hypothetical protein
MLKELDIIGVDGRRCVMWRRKGQMDIAKPGRVGSYDGYNKLKPSGIEIYGIVGTKGTST